MAKINDQNPSGFVTIDLNAPSRPESRPGSPAPQPALPPAASATARRTHELVTAGGFDYARYAEENPETRDTIARID